MPVALLLALLGCSFSGDAEVVPSQDTLDLGTCDYTSAPARASLTFTNVGTAGFRVEDITEEDTSGLLRFEVIPPDADIWPGDIFQVALSLDPDVTAWQTATHDTSLLLSLRLLENSSGCAGSPVLPGRSQTVTWGPVHYEVRCDLDYDRAEAQACGGADCDDLDPYVHAPSNWYLDQDGDDYGVSTTFVFDCDPGAGWSADRTDCDDTQASIYPGAPEYCGDVDHDCDGETDDRHAVDRSTWYADEDGDGYGDPYDFLYGCDAPTGYVADNGDCDDGADRVHPDAAERCNGRDDDCDGDADEDTTGTLTWYTDADEDGYGDPTTGTNECLPPTGAVEDDSDCDDGDSSIHPGAAETCDGRDNDCDSLVDDDDGAGTPWYADEDADGWGSPIDMVSSCLAPPGYVAATDDCDDGDASVHPGAPDYCSPLADGIDNDCDRLVDDPSVVWPFYVDEDGDGWGQEEVLACAPPDGSSLWGGDCDEEDPAVHPEAPEVCRNGLDDNCDGSTIPCGIDGDMDLSDADSLILGDTGALLGQAVLLPGDVDGDGLEDVLAGGPGLAFGLPTGAAYLYPGSPSWPAVTLPSDATAVLVGALDSRTGTSLGASDLDGDGAMDLLVGACAAEGDTEGAGAVWVTPGPVEGAVFLDAGPRLSGAAFLDEACRVAIPGDMDGDGRDEVIVGAPSANGAIGDEGVVYLLDPDVALAGASLTVDSRALLFGEVSGDQAGAAVAQAGDLDGDGLADLLVGAPESDAGVDKGGAVYVILGSGIPTDLASAPLRFVGAVEGGMAGAALEGLGDLDGDGLGEMAVGAAGSGVMADGAGVVYIVTGVGALSGTVDLASSPLTFLGVDPKDRSGCALGQAGDLDEDGVEDLLVGANWAEDGGGTVYAVTEHGTGTISLADSWATLVGTQPHGLAGYQVAGGADLDGDLRPDLLVGAPASSPETDESGTVYLLLNQEE